MIVLIAGQIHDLPPELAATLKRYVAWPAWRRWLWRKGIGT
jgi:hypothetical protein